MVLTGTMAGFTGYLYDFYFPPFLSTELLMCELARS